MPACAPNDNGPVGAQSAVPSTKRADAPGPNSAPKTPSNVQCERGVALAPALARQPPSSRRGTRAAENSASSYSYRSPRARSESHRRAETFADAWTALYGTGLNAPHSVHRLKYGRYLRAPAE